MSRDSSVPKVEYAAGPGQIAGPAFDRGGRIMSATHISTRRIVAPAMLGLETRSAFLADAIALLEEMPEGVGALVVDFAGTRSVDSAGLGALMLVQRRAVERRQPVVLRQMSEELRFLLTLTKLDDLFEFEPGPPRR